MIFKVKRTSVFEEDESPCEGAKKCLATVPQRTRDDGTVWEGYTFTYWTIELSTLEELMAFTEKNGRLVFSHYHPVTEGWPDLPEIEIYDDYRE